MTRPIIGLGHSVGATALINLSVFHPRLLSHLLLFEPILGFSRRDCTSEGIFFAHFAAAKTDVWPSRPIAEQYFRRSPPYKSWSPHVFERWLRHGLTTLESDGEGSKAEKQPGSVRLATGKHQEAVTYIRPLFSSGPVSEESVSYERLPIAQQRHHFPDLDPQVARPDMFYCPASSVTVSHLPELRSSVRYVFGGRSVMSPQRKQEEILATTGVGVGGSGGVSAGKVSSVVLPNGSHLLVFEDPEVCADLAYKSICEAAEESRAQDESHMPRPSSFALGTAQVSERWRQEAKRQVDLMLASKVKL